MNGNVVARVEQALRKAAPWPGPVVSSGSRHPHQLEILMAVVSHLGADGYGSDDTSILSDMQKALGLQDNDHLRP